MDVVPVVVQPLNVPLSKPPFVMPPPPPPGFTVSVTVVLWVALVPVPVTVIGYVPVGVVGDVVMVIVELAPELIGFGLKVAVAPVGRPLAESDTDWDWPWVTVVEMVEVPLPPW